VTGVYLAISLYYFMTNYNGWHVLRVKPHHERKVHNLLLKSSLEAYLPLVKTVRKWSDRKKTILKPLFPSYVFVKINSSIDFHVALSISGAFAYIKFGAEYAKVREDEIHKIKLLLDNNIHEEIQVNIVLPKIGELVNIKHGPLANLDCEILKVNNKNKIIVRIASLQQNIVATISSKYLIKF
jgi:transcriptional antiterminator RfaH